MCSTLYIGDPGPNPAPTLGPGPGRRNMTRRPLHFLASALVALCIVGPGDLVAQEEGSTVRGRVVEAGSARAVRDAEVSLDGTTHEVATDANGLFRLRGVSPGLHVVRVRHLAYGEFTGQIDLRAIRQVSLMVRLSQRAIELEPIVVRATPGAGDTRGTGNAVSQIDRDEIEAVMGSAKHIGDVLQQYVSSIQVRRPGNRSGAPLCIEFRAPRSLLDPNSCHPPAVYMDGVRMASPAMVWGGVPVETLQSIEVMPAGAAGAVYGTGTSFGVMRIRTRSAAADLAPPTLAPTRDVYDWSLETRPYPWLKVAGASLLGNAAGLALGALAGSGCVNVGAGEVFRNSDCGTAAAAGSRAAMVGLPAVGSALAARWAGRTDLSRGRLLPHVFGAALILVPGYFLASAEPELGQTAKNSVGDAFVYVGMPIMATVLDRLFRRVSGRR